MKAVIAFAFLSLALYSSAAASFRAEDLVGEWRYIDRIQGCHYVFERNRKFHGEVTYQGRRLSEFRGRWSVEGDTLLYPYSGDALGLIQPGSVDHDKLLSVAKNYFVIRAADGSERNTSGFAKARDEMLPTASVSGKYLFPNKLQCYKNCNSRSPLETVKKFVRRALTLAVAVFLLISVCGCHQRVTLIPGEDDLVVLNGCVVSACNYLAVVKAQHRLENNFWAKILLVRFDNHPAGHAYCVWETEGNIYGYDRNSGSFQLPVYTKDARAIAIVLAQELSKVLREPLAVNAADFIQSNNVELFKYTGLELSPSPTSSSIATAFGAISLVKP